MTTRIPVIVEAVRTPMGRHGGQLGPVRPDDMAAIAIRGLLERVPTLDPEKISDVYFGCSNQAGEDNRNIARMAVLLAGLPESVPGCTVNRLCASGLEAINAAARGIIAGEGDVYLAGGVESMSRAPWAIAKSEKAFGFGNKTAYDTALGWRFPNKKHEARFPLESNGETGENVAERYSISREAQDGFALESHQKAAVASDNVFSEEIVPVTVPRRKGDPIVIETDETFRRDTNLEKLGALKPVFRKGGSVTAGNSSSLNDGASALLVMEAEAAKKAGLKPLAIWRGAASAGLDPRVMGLGPVFATNKLLKRLSMNIADFDLIEINEAFAVQVLACIADLKIDPSKVNVNGGAIALGHPLGCSGARIVTTLLHEMRRRGAKRGLATLCIGLGQGLSTVFEAP
ncbi:MAG: acetyl-CoA C-acyltransferase [Elusimicrobia bacterium]|nr:MAG: acetyl-CoA C-acyltransferase [Elusimicrobiota bacterium]